MFRIIDAFLYAFERLWQHRILVFWALLGLAVATTLALSLTLYVDAVNTELLTTRLDDPPYAFRLRYIGSWEGNISQNDVATTDDAVEGALVNGLGLPVAHQVQYVRGGAWTLRRVEGEGEQQNLGAFNIGTLTGFEEQIQVVDGMWPPEKSNDEIIPVLMSEEMFFETGLEVGDEIGAMRPGGQAAQLRIDALWRPLNPNDPYWVFPPQYFEKVLLVQPDDLWAILGGQERPVEEVAWYLVFDGSEVRTSDVPELLGKIADGEREILGVLPGTRMDASPIHELEAFNAEAEQLTQQLVIMVLPVAGLVLYFVSLVAGLLVNRQQSEDAILSSRGMSRRAILGNHLLMWLILAAAAFGLGLVAAPYLVRLVGQTESFLRFQNEAVALEVVFTQDALLAGGLTSLVAASSGLLVAWRSSRQTITSFRQQAARAGKAWWQRYYLDMMALIPAAYVFYTLEQAGGLETGAEDPFGDPLVFVGPTLFALGLSLLFLRLWPMALRLVAWVVAYGQGISLLMALRELTRSTGRYRGALLMMCFTLSLTGFMASMASTIDASLVDTVDYRTGADMVMVIATDAQTEESDDGETTEVTGFNILPATDLLEIDGVAHVSRVGRYSAQLMLPGQRPQGTWLGIDRAAIAAVTRARSDYASEPYADLFNRLAGNRTGVVVSQETFNTYNLRIGQEIAVQVSALGEWYETRVPVLGVIKYFPTLDPTEGFFLLGNIEPIFELVGTQLPHDVWLNLEPGTDPESVLAEAQGLGFPVLEMQYPERVLEEAKLAPARRGVLGFLSVGFVASIALTLVVSVIQSASAFRAQSLQLGSLRAMGLGGLAVGAYLLLSQGLAALSGILGGTAIGLFTTSLFLPLLDFSTGLPPYQVRVAWDDIFLVYLTFASILFAVTFLTTVLLSRERLATVIKIGDA